MRALAEAIIDARARTLALVADLPDEALVVPRLAIVNPILWELAHVAWFQEHWVLRHAAGRAPIHREADALYDSARIPHDVRWDLPLFSRAKTLAYLREARDGALERLASPTFEEPERYFHWLAVFHEDMHGEALLYTRQTLGYPRPRALSPLAGVAQSLDSAAGDVEFAGGTFRLGAERSDEFVFDNEKWAHAVEVPPFAIARAAVSESEFQEFVEEGGYARRELWSADGWRWREALRAEHPLHWRREGKTWLRRRFDAWSALEPRAAMVHVNWHEAEAFCRFAKRRLPTEAEWELAASASAAVSATGGGRKRRYPWGDEEPRAEHANLDAHAQGCVSVDAFAPGDSALGCRQMFGNVWEWTASELAPYPGFVRDPYQEYSEPWFGTHKVLRGGCWATRARLLRNTWRNFFLPERRDVFAGFRTCAPRERASSR